MNKRRIITAVVGIVAGIVLYHTYFKPKQAGNTFETTTPVDYQQMGQTNIQEYVSQVDDYEYVKEFTYSVSHNNKKLPIVEAKVSNGQVILSFNKSNIIRLNLLDDWTNSQSSVLVGGIIGLAKGVFIADAGKNVNPLLCVIMDDGQVGVLSLMDAVRKWDFEVECINNLKNVVAFKAVQSYRTINNERLTRRTIVAVDNQGQDVELQLPIYLHNTLSRYYKERDHELWNIRLNSDLKLEITGGWAGSEVGLLVYGRFRPITEDYVAQKFRYSFELTKIEHPGEPGTLEGEDDGSSVEHISQSGIFEIKVEANGAYMITVVKGEKKTANMMGFYDIKQTIDYYQAGYWVKEFEAQLGI